MHKRLKLPKLISHKKSHSQYDSSKRHRGAGVVQGPSSLSLKLALLPCLLILIVVINHSSHHQRHVNKAVQSPQQAVKKILENITSNVSWQNFPAATQTGNKVDFGVIDRKIVNQDGTGGQDNPAVNVKTFAGFNGNFAINYTMSSLSDTPATLRFYAQPPVIYDEWRFEPASLSVGVSFSAVTVTQWDGNAQKPFMNRIIQRQHSASTATVRFERRDNAIAILEGQTELAVIPAKQLFDQNKLWFGASALKPWTLDSLTGSALGASNFAFYATNDTVEVPSDSLGKLASDKRASLKVGAAMSLYPLLSNDQYRSLALVQFSMMTTENDLKSQFIHPAKDQYDFTNGDALVDIAQKNKLIVHGHALVFGEANAQWMQQTPRQDLPAVMDDHISSVVGHYNGRVAEWDVINEPLSDNDSDYEQGGNGLRRHIWYNAMGSDYIARALRVARKADPSAKLYINDYGLEEDGDRWDALMKIIDQLQANNVPLDGIGFEAHVYESSDHIDPTVLKKHMAQLASKHLLSRISEMDVHGENRTTQAKEYADVFQACLDTATCTSFSTWGISDAYGSTTSDHSYPLEFGNDLLWDKNFIPKPALTSIKNKL